MNKIFKMIKKTIFIILLLVIEIQLVMGQKTIEIKFGASNVTFEVVENKCDTLVFINLHNNEQTSVTAIKQILKTRKGTFIGLQSDKKRELSITTRSQTISFDPNRIFTSIGAEKTLKNYN